MGHLINCNPDNPNYPLADMTPEEKGKGRDRIYHSRRSTDRTEPELVGLKSDSQKNIKKYKF